MGWFSRWFSGARGAAGGGVAVPARGAVVKGSVVAGKGPAQRVVKKEVGGAVHRPVRIAGPVVGFLNLQGAAGGTLSKGDRETLGSMFAACRVSAGAVPRCDVLFVYCDLDAEGRVAGRPEGVWEIIKGAGARVGVVASENAAAHCRAAAERRADWAANLVMAVDRKGDVLADFFRRLFQEMFAERTMHQAWVDLAPRIEGEEFPDVPEVVVLAEAGEVGFEG